MDGDSERAAGVAPKAKADFPKRQHFVPETMQKRFVDPDGQLWFFDRRRKDGIERTRPGNLFVEGHLYTLEGNDGGRSGAIEAFLSRLESETASTLDQLIEAARRGAPPKLHDEQRWALVLFIYLQHKRVPDFLRNVPRERSMAEELAKLVEETEAEGAPMSPEARAEYLSAQTARRFEKNLTALAVVGDFMASKTFLAFNARGISTAVVDRPGTSFVLGGFPIFRSSGPAGTSLDQPEVEIWMPIAPDVAVGLGGAQQESHVIPVGTGRKVLEMNNYIRDRSTVVASPSRYLVDVLSRKMTGPTTWQRVVAPPSVVGS